MTYFPPFKFNKKISIKTMTYLRLPKNSKLSIKYGAYDLNNLQFICELKCVLYNINCLKKSENTNIF